MVIIGLLPIYLLISATLVILTRLILKREFIVDLVAIILGFILLVITSYVTFLTVEQEIIVYRFGGFPPPLGIVYVVDKVSAALSVLASFSLITATIYSMWLLAPKWRYLFYSLTFLLTAGVVGCLYTGDMFNFFVSLELLAISSYALTAFYRGSSRAIRAAVIYAIAGSIATSLYLLATFLTYASYGTLNMADVALKARNPEYVVLFSGRAYGDIVLPTIVAMILILWAMLFKSGIIPNHFWLLDVYTESPTPAVALFTSSADIIGVYGVSRFFSIVWGEEILIEHFRPLLFNIALLIASISALASALLVVTQTNIRRLVAYSTISQLSLAFMGVLTGVPEGISGAILHLITNGLGDMLMLYSAGIAIISCGKDISCLSTLRSNTIAYVAFIIGSLNLFGIFPLLPGFWSKALLTLGFLKAELFWGVIVILASSGLCAAGYFKAISAIFKLKKSSFVTVRATIPAIVLATLILFTLTLGVLMVLNSHFREFIIQWGYDMIDYKKYIVTTLNLTI